MSVDPTEVHPEHDRPTPDNWDDWDDEQLDEYKQAAEAELQAEAEANQRELRADEQAARDALVAGATDQIDTETVSLHEHVDIDDEIDIEVRTTLSGGAIEKLESIEEDDPASEVLPTVLDVLEEVVEGPEGYASRAVWRDVFRNAGVDVFMDYVDALTDPAEETLEAVGRFREDGPRAGPP